MKNWKTAVKMLSAAALACLAACSNNSGGSNGEPSRGDAGASSGGDGGGSSEGSTGGSDSGSGRDSGSDSSTESGSDSGGSHTCEVDNTGNYFVCASGQTGYYCVLSDTPVQDGLATACSQPMPDQTGLGSDYCCQ